MRDWSMEFRAGKKPEQGLLSKHCIPTTIRENFGQITSVEENESKVMKICRSYNEVCLSRGYSRSIVFQSRINWCDIDASIITVVFIGM